MNPLMTQSTSNTILTFILRDTFYAILEGFVKPIQRKQERREKGKGKGWGISSEKGVSPHKYSFSGLHLETVV